MKNAPLCLLILAVLGGCDKQQSAAVPKPDPLPSITWQFASAPAPVSTPALTEVEIGEDDPEYWAVLQIMSDQGLSITEDHSMSKAVLDCAEAQQKKLLKWSRTISDIRVRSAWAMRINHNLGQLSENRRAAVPKPTDTAQSRGLAMANDLNRPPALECDPP